MELMSSRFRSCNSEADVKRYVKALLKAYKIWYFMPGATQFGKSGIPDFICCCKGKFFAIETKFGHNIPTDLQYTRMQEIRDGQGIAVWVNEDRLQLLERLLQRLTNAA